MKQYLALLLAGATAVAAWSAVPQGYYDRAAGKSTSQLKTALHEIINPHTEVSSYSALPSYFQKTDLYPESSRWWDMYSTIPLYAPSFKGLNREHSFPKSWWGGATDIPAYVDLNHLYPAESAANMAKSNYPLGVVTGSPKFDNGWSTVGRGVNSGGAPYVFEPADEFKGDFARTYFYM
ncbi:MAG: endonuclease, partial [Paramuribaculum sp.]|nr:endonuclease [Paramuribaculum sp.]